MERSKQLGWLRLTALIALAYYLGAALGLILAIPPGYITLIWPPSGLAFAAVLIYGRRALPGILIGAFVSNIHFGENTLVAVLASSLIIGIGSCLQPLAGRWLLTRFGVSWPFNNLRAAGLFGLTTLLMALISCSLGTAGLMLTGVLQANHLRTLLTWWAGDGVGILVFTPLLLFLLNQSFRSDRQRFLALILIMAGTSFTIVVLAITSFYNTHLESQRLRLIENAQMQARLMESVARVNTQDSNGQITIDQLKTSYENSTGFSETGQYQLARRKGDTIEYVLSYPPAPGGLPTLPFAPASSQPMFRALSGESGAMVGTDYRGLDVLAAYEPIAGLDLGLVVKTDMSEIRRPFIEGAAFLTLITLALVTLSIRWFQSISAPLVSNLRRQSAELQKLVDEQTVELRANETRFKALLDSAPEAMVIVDTQGQIVLVNSKLCQISGYEVEELVGHNIEILVPLQKRVHHVGLRNGYIANPTPRALDDTKFQLSCQCKDGQQFPVSISLNAIETETGRLIAASIRDVTEQKAYEEKLRTGEARVTLALESGDMEAYEIDLDSGRIESKYQLYQKYGYPKPASNKFEVGNNSWTNIVHPDDRARMQSELSLFLTGKSPKYQINYRVLTNDGSVRWIETNGMITARRDDGSARKMIGLRRDITEITLSQLAAEEARKKVHESQQLLEGIIENSSHVIYVKLKDGKYHFVNKAYEQYSGMTRAELVGKDDSEIFGHEVGSKLRENDLTVMNSRTLATYFEHCWDRIFLSNKFPLFDIEGNLNGLCGISADVTEQKQLEQDLIQAKALAEAATQAKANFLASMSHEIRTPMNAVIGMVDLLRQTQLSDDQNEMLQTVSQSGQSLLTIINDILDISKIESGKLQLESIAFSLAESVEGAVKTVSVNAQAKGLGLITWIDPALPSHVCGDPVRLRQIVINLVGNAIKFTESGKVLIRVALLEQHAERLTLRLSVKDQGIGISRESQQNLFREFTQAESSTTRRFGGTGLGLSICKRLSELMGGSIRVESELGHGSEFIVELHFPIDATKHADDVDDKDLFKDVSIIVVDRNAQEVEVLRSYLTHLCATVQTSDSLSDCKALCLSAASVGKPVDIVLIGSDWPRGEQFALAPQLPGTRVIALLIGKRNKPRIQTEDTLTLDIVPFTRTGLINAVSIALGRESPSVYHEKVEDLKSADRSLSIAEAEAARTLILVAEDNPTNRDVIGRQLRLLGYTCEMADNGKEALTAWESGRYAILLTDCHMPEMDGFELTAAIRAQEQQRDTAEKRFPIIAITANALQGEAERCIAAGMDGYMSKPIDIKELRNTLRRYLVQPELSHIEPVAPSPSVQVIAEKTAAVDESVLKGMFGDDDQMFREILTDSIAPSQAIVREIHLAWESKSAHGVQQGAHKLKSAARSIGANALADTCAILEHAGKQNQLAEEEAMTALDGLMAAVVGYINDIQQANRQN